MGAMELKRLGMVNKPLIVVPGHMLEQFTRKWLELYPQAVLLSADTQLNIIDTDAQMVRPFKYEAKLAEARETSKDLDAKLKASLEPEKAEVQDKTPISAGPESGGPIEPLDPELQALKTQMASDFPLAPGSRGQGIPSTKLESQEVTRSTLKAAKKDVTYKGR